jgi:transposase
VQPRTALQHERHDLLKADGVVSEPETFRSAGGLENVLPVPREPSSRCAVERLVTEMRHRNEAVAKRAQEWQRPGQQGPGHQTRTGIEGISDTGATLVLTTIGHVADFKAEKARASSFGIVPRVYQSHQTLHDGRLTNRGNEIARTALVQSTVVAIRYSPSLRAFDEPVKARRGSGKAISATSRKLRGIIDDTLKHDWVFEDFTTFTFATSS